MTKHIDTLVDDVYDMFREGLTLTGEQKTALATRMVEAIDRFLQKQNEVRKPSLRPSIIGYPDRKLFFMLKEDSVPEPSPSLKLNFLFGDLWESIMFYLADLAGHEVKDEQASVEIDGVVGSIDGVIDGVVTDTKTAFAANYDKFLKGTLLAPEKDVYGYVGQISFYTQAYHGVDYATSEESGYFWATNKTGNMTTLEIDPIDQIDARKRVRHVRELLTKKEPPESLCYPVEELKNGNIVANKQCHRCPFIERCFPDARRFQYASGVQYFTHVESTPRVEELTRDSADDG